MFNYLFKKYTTEGNDELTAFMLAEYDMKMMSEVPYV